MIFIDTWAWIALADDTDQYHAAAVKQHRKLLKKNRRYVTTDAVVGELIDALYDAAPEPQARGFISGLLAKVETGALELVHISPEYFRRAWELRQKYRDKPDISFVDFTSMVVMQDLGIAEVFTGDQLVGRRRHRDRRHGFGRRAGAISAGGGAAGAVRSSATRNPIPGSWWSAA